MLGDFWNFLMGNIGQGATGGQPTAGVPAPSTTTPMPSPVGNPAQGQYGPPMPAYMQNLSPAPGAPPAQGQDLRQQLIMKMLQQGMMGQGQGGQPQSPQVPPMSMAPGRPGMAPTGGMGAAASLAQGMRPPMMARRPLGMGY